MICPNCNKPISVFNPTEDLTKSTIYCEHCNSFFPLSLALRNYTKCICGAIFNEIYKEKKLRCFNCYRTFREEIQNFFGNKQLDEIYLLEKHAIKKYIIETKNNSLIRSRFYLFNEILQEYQNKNQHQPILLKSIQEVPIDTKDWEISLRMRYTRNVQGLSYSLKPELIYLLSDILLNSNSFIIKNLIKYYNILEITETDLIENLNIQNNLEYQNLKVLLLNNQLLTRFYVGEEDHFRVETFYFFNHSTNVENIIETIFYVYKFYQLLDSIFLWQVNPEFGFLTACPSNAGSGIRIYLRFKLNHESRIKNLYFFQRNDFFKRLKNYSIRGDMGEGSQIKDYLTIGWDVPYLDMKNFESDLKKKLIYWFYEILSYSKIY